MEKMNVTCSSGNILLKNICYLAKSCVDILVDHLTIVIGIGAFFALVTPWAKRDRNCWGICWDRYCAKYL